MRPRHQRAYELKAQSACATYKLEAGCAICGYNEHPDALEFDHINGGGGHAYISNTQRTVPWLLRMIEDPNVQVLCSNHHAIKSATERRAPWEEGLDV